MITTDWCFQVLSRVSETTVNLKILSLPTWAKPTYEIQFSQSSWEPAFQYLLQIRACQSCKMLTMQNFQEITLEKGKCVFVSLAWMAKIWPSSFDCLSCFSKSTFSEWNVFKPNTESTHRLQTGQYSVIVFYSNVISQLNWFGMLHFPVKVLWVDNSLNWKKKKKVIKRQNYKTCLE